MATDSEIQVRFFHTNPLAAENPLSEGSTQPLGPPFPGASSVPVSEHDSPAYVDPWADPELGKKLKSINMPLKFSGQLELQPPLAWNRWVNQLRYVMRSRGLTTTWQQCVGFGEALAGPPLDLFLAEVHGAAIVPTFDEFLSRLSSQYLPRTNLQHWVMEALANAKLQSDESVQQYVLRLCELFRLSSSPKSIEDQHLAFLKGLPPSLQTAYLDRLQERSDDGLRDEALEPLQGNSIVKYLDTKNQRYLQDKQRRAAAGGHKPTSRVNAATVADPARVQAWLKTKSEKLNIDLSLIQARYAKRECFKCGSTDHKLPQCGKSPN